MSFLVGPFHAVIPPLERRLRGRLALVLAAVVGLVVTVALVSLGTSAVDLALQMLVDR